MKTEDGFDFYYDEYYFAVYLDNHPISKGTEQERELYKPYEFRVHFGAGINTFGMKIFKKKENALKWCKENKKASHNR